MDSKSILYFMNIFAVKLSCKDLIGSLCLFRIMKNFVFILFIYFQLLAHYLCTSIQILHYQLNNLYHFNLYIKRIDLFFKYSIF